MTGKSGLSLSKNVWAQRVKRYHNTLTDLGRAKYGNKILYNLSKQNYYLSRLFQDWTVDQILERRTLDLCV